MADEPAFAPIQICLTVKGGDAASKFYQQAFGAKESQRMLAEDKKRLMHCDLAVFGGSVMLSDEFPEMGNADTLSPVTRGGASATIQNVVAAVARKNVGNSVACGIYGSSAGEDEIFDIAPERERDRR